MVMGEGAWLQVRAAPPPGGRGRGADCEEEGGIRCAKCGEGGWLSACGFIEGRQGEACTIGQGGLHTMASRRAAPALFKWHRVGSRGGAAGAIDQGR